MVFVLIALAKFGDNIGRSTAKLGLDMAESLKDSPVQVIDYTNKSRTLWPLVKEDESGLAVKVSKAIEDIGDDTLIAVLRSGKESDIDNLQNRLIKAAKIAKEWDLKRFFETDVFKSTLYHRSFYYRFNVAFDQAYYAGNEIDLDALANKYHVENLQLIEALNEHLEFRDKSIKKLAEALSKHDGVKIVNDSYMIKAKKRWIDMLKSTKNRDQ